MSRFSLLLLVSILGCTAEPHLKPRLLAATSCSCADAAIPDAVAATPDAIASDASGAVAPDASIAYSRPAFLADPTGVHIPAHVYAPASCAASGCPLLLAFHGFGGTSADALSRLYLANAATWAVVVIPDGVKYGVNQFWNASASCCDVSGLHPNDLAYASNLITQVSSGYPIDPNKISAAGWSNGGAFAEALACYDSRVADALNLSGPPVGCGRGINVTILRAHGLLDPTISYSGGNFHGLPTPYAAADDATVNGCTGFATTGITKDYNASVAGAETTIYGATGCTGSLVDLYVMAGTNHIPSMKTVWTTDATAWLRGHTK